MQKEILVSYGSKAYKENLEKGIFLLGGILSMNYIQAFLVLE